MNFFKIQNNTNNSIIVNGTFIGPKSDAVLSEDAVSLIDKQYFDSGILMNHGLASINNDYVMIDTRTVQFYKKPPSGIPKNHLDKEVNTSLKKADLAVQKGTITIDDLDEDLKNLIKTIGSGGSKQAITAMPPMRSKASSNQIPQPESNSVLIRERQFEQLVLDKINQGVLAYKKVSEDKIGYEDLTEELKFLFDQLAEQSNETWKDPVFSYDLLPLTGNKNGDVRLTLDNNSLWRWRSEDTNQWEPISDNSGSGGSEGVPTPDLRPRFVLGEFFADLGQQRFKASHSYVMDNNSLQVLLNGILMIKDDDYLEIDEYTIEFLYPLEEDDYVVMSTIANGQDPYIIVETVVVKTDNIRIAKFQHAFDPNNTEALQVFLNGISVTPGEEDDYMINDSSSIRFHYDLEEGDKITIRFASAVMIDNIGNQFAQVQKVYQTLSRQVKLLQDKVEARL